MKAGAGGWNSWEEPGEDRNGEVEVDKCRALGIICMHVAAQLKVTNMNLSVTTDYKEGHSVALAGTEGKH